MSVYKSLSSQLGITAASLLICLACACHPEPEPPLGISDEFETVPEKFPIAPGIIDEASGLAQSHSMSGFLWTIQDAQGPNSLYLVNKDGKSIKEINVPGTVNRDWEEVASGPGPADGANYIYIGDIGNNNAPTAPSCTIYRVREINDPNAFFNESMVEKINFTYPDGPRDAESLIVDPVTKDIFVIAKGLTSGIYRLPYPQSTGEMMTAEKVGDIPSVSIATGATISRDGSEILVRTYLAVHYWRREEGQTIAETITKPSRKILTVAIEPQGESVCFDLDGSGFYTLSERSNASSVSLNFYKRK
ncbi:PE-PGRS family protein [Dyadobacter aurulentus]|uniref:PE-PGRS family protein n=1 Tax=Dyadobacter sp. UC 10 TaxID=2605428 RepID=UPI0011F11C75|nr:PE-PGRS family protein [Dyadobacter sp. UC 10]KAA0991319.1 PE-PGRS family protein [Dyadobacter sp. UC 10]